MEMQLEIKEGQIKSMDDLIIQKDKKLIDLQKVINSMEYKKSIS